MRPTSVPSPAPLLGPSDYSENVSETGRNAPRIRPISAGFSKTLTEPVIERGRMLRWVAGDEALIASRRTPSVKSRSVQPSKEAHDSPVPVFQCRRSAKPPRRGTRRPRRREPTSASGPAGHHYQAREIASAQYETDLGLAMTAPGFSPQSRTQSVDRLAMTAGASLKRHVHRR